MPGVNNLCGWSMTQAMPTRKFTWLDDEEISSMMDEPSTIQSCTLKVDLEYPENLHDAHSDYPFAPELIELDRVKKLVPNLNDKKNYVVHHLALRQALKNGLTLTKIHRGIKYKETMFLKKYIDLNTNLRKASKNWFEKDFFKLMVNSVFGKTMENVRCRSNVKIVNEKNERKLLGLISQPNLKSVYRYENSDLVSLNMGKSFATFNITI